LNATYGWNLEEIEVSDGSGKASNNN